MSDLSNTVFRCPEGRIVVTGASGGMGSAAVRALTAGGCRVVMACRDLEKGARVRDAILADYPASQIELRQVELSSLASVKAFADTLLSEGIPIAGLFNNAGTMNRRFSLSADGYEKTLAVNYLAPMLLCELLAPSMPDGGHIVNMVSMSSDWHPLNEKMFLKDADGDGYSQLASYARSKRALMTGSVTLSERFPHLKVNVADPGIVSTDIIRLDRWFDPLADVLFRPFIKRPARGVAPALRALFAACSGHIFKGGSISEGFYGKGGSDAPILKKYAQDPRRASLAATTADILAPFVTGR